MEKYFLDSPFFQQIFWVTQIWRSLMTLILDKIYVTVVYIVKNMFNFDWKYKLSINIAQEIRCDGF